MIFFTNSFVLIKTLQSLWLKSALLLIFNKINCVSVDIHAVRPGIILCIIINCLLSFLCQQLRPLIDLWGEDEVGLVLYGILAIIPLFQLQSVLFLSFGMQIKFVGVVTGAGC